MNAYALFALARRNIKVFLKDKANVFFSLLAPLIVLALVFSTAYLVDATYNPFIYFNF